MLYSNPEYFIFFLFVWVLYYLTGKTQDTRLWILVAASWFFYVWAGFFDALIFAFILAVSWVSVWMAERAHLERSRQFYLAGGIIVMGLHLFFWKYVPWISTTVQDVYPAFLGGVKVQFPLPIGISFFTLLGIAYLIDYGRNEAQYVKFKDYMLFKSFFPQLVAGPIVRMHQMGPQLRNLPMVNSAHLRDGLTLFSIGFFKKVAIADRMAVLVDPVFSNPANYTTSSILLALLAYTVQIWGDFSGYTDMGRGAAKMLGVNLPENFFSPYLSKSPSEFWRRWHVTLSQWIRDYIYIPLGGSSGGAARTAAVVIITMAISGLWHGAAFTFLLWGLYHGALLAFERLTKRLCIPIFEGKAATIYMFVLIMFGWLIFRSESISSLVTTLLIVSGEIPSGNLHVSTLSVAWGVACCFLIQFFTYTPLGADKYQARPRPSADKVRQAFIARSPIFRAALSGVGVAMIIVLSLLMRVSDTSNKFIYFQF